ncbi:MAG: hypothetical protein WCT48_05340 [Candidatus Paceibacterota bacterium]|jgi:hypothetical protein
MNSPNVSLIVIILTPVGFVIFFALKYVCYCDDICEYLRRKDKVLWEKWYKDGKIQPLCFYGLNYLNTGIFAQFKTLRYIEEQLPGDSTVFVKINKMRTTLSLGLGILFISFVAVILFDIIKYI